jgi:prolyl-tRNA editing enzyme YbaK/EbsC (Cys-tRNA(Pro) deacylase)
MPESPQSLQAAADTALAAACDVASPLSELLARHPEIELIELDKDVPTSEIAAEVFGMDISDVAKTLIIKTGNAEVVALVLRGNDRIDQAAVKAVTKCKKFRFCTAEETLAFTSYPAGGIPPIGLGPLVPRVVVDSKVMRKEWVIGGGGARPKLIKLTPALLVQLSFALIADISSTA